MRSFRSLLCVVALLVLTDASTALAQVAEAPQPRRALPVQARVGPSEGLKQEDVLLRYHEDTAVFVEDLRSGLPAVMILVESPLSGVITDVGLPLYNGPLLAGGQAAGVQGTGTLSLELFDADAARPGLAASPLARYDAPFDSLAASPELPVVAASYNRFDLTDAGFDVEAGRPYYLRFRLVDASPDAALTFLTDEGSIDTTDRDYYPEGFPARTFIYLIDGEVEPEQQEGYYRYPDNANLIAEATVVGSAPTAAEGVGGPQQTFELLQNYPNPFRSVTTIAFELRHAESVHLTVFNLLGKPVATLFEGRLGPGRHQVTWDASTMASGLYLYRLETGTSVVTRRMSLVR